MAPGEPELAEADAYPVLPDYEYGWEKLHAERTAMAYGQRFKNGGAHRTISKLLRRHVAGWPGEGTSSHLPQSCASPGWRRGSAVRSYTYIEDMVDGIYRLMQSELEGPVNIGNPEYVSVDELVRTVIDVARKDVKTRHVDGPIGVRSRNFSNQRIESLGWRAQWRLRRGIESTILDCRLGYARSCTRSSTNNKGQRARPQITASP
jgi:GDP-D-mannose 3', 5'-epimerase